MVEIVYWSGTGNTEAMAREILAAVKDAGAEGELVRFEDTTVNAVTGHDVILMGCPAMGNEALEESVVEPFFEQLKGKLNGKKVGLFGSYGWGDGTWMTEWKKRVTDAGADFIEPEVIVMGTPDHSVECAALGKKAASFG